MSTIIRINAPAKTGGFSGGVHLAVNGAVLDVTLDDSSSYEVITATGTAPPPAPQPAPPPTPVPPPTPAPVPAGVEVVTIAWPKAGESQTLPRPEIQNFTTQPVALKMQAPASLGTAVKVGRFSAAEKPGFQRVFRECTATANPGDFTSGGYFYNGLGQPDVAPSGLYCINDPTGFKERGCLFNLQPGGPAVYFNLRNQYNGQSTVPEGLTVDMQIEFGAPV